jgi:hypothetical protein
VYQHVSITQVAALSAASSQQVAAATEQTAILEKPEGSEYSAELSGYDTTLKEQSLDP